MLPVMSPDGRLLADRGGTPEHNTVGLWDIKTRAVVKTLVGHSSRIDRLDFSPDSKRVVSTSHKDGTTRLWDAVTGATLQTVNTGYTEALGVSRNGLLMAWVYWDDAIKVWDTATTTGPRRLLHGQQGGGGSGPCLAMSPNGKLLAVTLHQDNLRTIRVLDAATGTVQQTLKGHLTMIDSLAFSPDGKLVASGSADGIVRLWNAVRSRVQETPGDDSSSTRIFHMALSPDGRTVALDREANTMRILTAAATTIELWDMSKGVLLRTLEGHSKTIQAVVFPPETGRLLSTSEDATRLWDLTTGTYLETLDPNLVCCKTVAFSLDGKLAASRLGLPSRTSRLWDRATGTALPSSVYQINAAAFSPDGKLMALASYDNSIGLWDAAATTILRVLNGHSTLSGTLEFSPNSRLLASAPSRESGGTIKLWDPAMGIALQALKGHSKLIHHMVFSPDSKTLASASEDRTVRLWDTATGAALRVLQHSKPVQAVAFSPDGTLIASEESNVRHVLWNVANGTRLQAPGGHDIETVAFSPDGKLVASFSKGANAIWSIETGVAKQALTPHGKNDMLSIFSPNGKQLASGSDNHAVGLWDTSTGAMTHALEGHTDSIISLAFSPDGKLIASSSLEQTIRLWDTTTGAAVHVLAGHSGYIATVVFSPDGKVIASSSQDRTLVLWDTETGATLQVLNNPLSSGTVTFSPDGKLVLKSNPASTIWLWDTETGATLKAFNDVVRLSSNQSSDALAVPSHRDGQLVASGRGYLIYVWNGMQGTVGVLEGHSDNIHALAFSPDDRVLMSASHDSIRLWDVATESALLVLEGHSAPVCTAAFSQDSKLIASSSADGTVTVWNAATGAAMETSHVDSSMRELAFSQTSSYLKTEKGVLAVRGITACGSADRQHVSNLFIRGNWVTWAMENYLWLPAEYREVRVSSVSDTIVFKHISGRVTFMELGPRDQGKSDSLP